VMGSTRNLHGREVYKTSWLENLEGRDHLRDLDMDRTIVFEWILKK